MTDASTNSRLYPARPLLAVSVACFRAGKVLLATRTRPPAIGALTLPGGLVEPGERLPEAALRELREEVGAEAEIVAFNSHAERIDRDPRWPGEAPLRHCLLRRALDRRRAPAGPGSRRNRLGRSASAPRLAADR